MAPGAEERQILALRPLTHCGIGAQTARSTCGTIRTTRRPHVSPNRPNDSGLWRSAWLALLRSPRSPICSRDGSSLGAPPPPILQHEFLKSPFKRRLCTGRRCPSPQEGEQPGFWDAGHDHPVLPRRRFMDCSVGVGERARQVAGWQQRGIDQQRFRGHLA